MRTRILSLALCGLLFVTGTTRAAPAAGDEAKVAEYVKALKSKNAAVRKQVALALGDLGGKAKAAVPALRGALLDSDEGVQAAAAGALEKINDKDAVAERDKTTAALRDRAVAAEIEARALKERNLQLLQQLEKLTKEVARLRKEGAPAGGGPKSAPENVEGLIKAVDETSGLVTITIGSDAGLRKGHKLEVYRLKPAPKYLGQVEIIEAEPTRAVGKPLGTAKDAIQKGDSVAPGVAKK